MVCKIYVLQKAALQWSCSVTAIKSLEKHQINSSGFLVNSVQYFC